MSHFTIENDGDKYAKRVIVKGPLLLYVDNDDVPTDQNALLIQVLVEILNKHWYDPHALFCENEDCERYGGCVSSDEIADPTVLECEKCGGPLAIRKVSL